MRVHDRAKGLSPRSLYSKDFPQEETAGRLEGQGKLECMTSDLELTDFRLGTD